MKKPSSAPDMYIAESVDMHWKRPLKPAGCSSCGQVHLIEDGYAGQVCPRCAAGKLDTQPAFVRLEPPELVIPFTKQKADLAPLLTQFQQGVWLRCNDFYTDMLLHRAVPVYWPMWLVDSAVTGSWEAEVGFDYQVQSSQESYDGSSWHSQGVIETHIRWEPRIGQIVRQYDTIAVPGISDHEEVIALIGSYDEAHAVTYNPSYLDGVLVRVPDIQPDQAWSLAQTTIARVAADECRHATDAQHIQSFTLRATYEQVSWTQRLHPMYATYYTDDTGTPHPMYINGTTGAIGGIRLASQRKGWYWAGRIAVVALVLFIVGVVVFLLKSLVPAVESIGAFLIMLSSWVFIAASVPALWPWFWNRTQRERAVVVK